MQYLQPFLVAVAAGALQIDRIDSFGEVVEWRGGGALERATALTGLAQEHLPAQHQQLTRLAVSIHLLCWQQGKGYNSVLSLSLSLSLSPSPLSLHYLFKGIQQSLFSIQGSN